MTASFDLWQQVFTLSWMANAGSGQQGEPTVIAKYLESTLDNFFTAPATQAAIGNWSIVWGPVVYEHKASASARADNAMYVATNADKSQYVVAIAATNAHSSYDWFDEDFDVEKVAAWATAFPSLGSNPAPAGLSPYVSAATALGINNLLGMVDTLQGTNQDLVTFLGSLTATSSAQITFAGHSLAGALSPTLALALFNPNGDTLALDKWSTVAAYPTAGATPGNGDFSTFFSDVLPPVAATSPAKPYQTWNQDTWNTIDVVPHAWEIATLDEIAKLYNPTWWIEPPELAAGIAFAKHRSNEGAKKMGEPYDKIANNPLAGTQQNPSIKTMKDFEAEALYQHTTAYEVLIGIQSVLTTDLSENFRSALVHVLHQPLEV